MGEGRERASTCDRLGFSLWTAQFCLGDGVRMEALQIGPSASRDLGVPVD
jgi:hypothetical protein